MKIASVPLLAVTLPLLSVIPAPAGILQEPLPNGLDLKSAGPLAFAPGGTLLIAESATGSIVALETGDTGPFKKLAAPVEDAIQKIAALLAADPATITVTDLTINPESGTAYLGVTRKSPAQVAIITVSADGSLAKLDTAALPHLRVPLPKSATGGQLRTLSGLAHAGDRLLVTGQCNEEFSSKIYSLPLPLTSTSSGQIFSAETYHVAHGRWETKAPITSFTPYVDQGVPCVVGAFACTPIAKFPVANLASGAAVKGTSVVELGSGNRPLDIFTYQKDGQRWFITHTQRFKDNLFGPSKYWGVRVSAAFLDASDPAHINENAARRDVRQKAGPAGIEIVDDLFGAVQVAKVDDSTMAVLRETGDTLRLELCALP